MHGLYICPTTELYLLSLEPMLIIKRYLNFPDKTVYDLVENLTVDGTM